MWQQWPTHGFQLHQDEPHETEDSGHFLSFAKRSREVHRRPAVTVHLPARDLHRSSSVSQHGEQLWENILRYPSEKAVWYDPCDGEPLSMFSKEPAETVCTGAKGANLSVDTLPSPGQLMRRRKQGGGRVQRGDAAQRQEAAVAQHIRDLRRKQSIIEQMKTEKWWGSTLGFTPENSSSFDVGGLTPPETPWSLDSSHTRAQYAAPSPAHLNSDTMSSQVFGGCEEMMDLAPGGNPMMSFVVTGTAHREAQKNWDTPCPDTPYVATPCPDTPYVATPHLDTPYLDTPHRFGSEFWGFNSII